MELTSCFVDHTGAGQTAALSWSLILAWDRNLRRYKQKHKGGYRTPTRNKSWAGGLWLTWGAREDVSAQQPLWQADLGRGVQKSSWNRRFPVTGRQLAEHPLDGWNCQCVLFTWHVMSGVIVPMSGGSLVKSCQRYRLPALSVEKDSPVHLCVSRCTSGQWKNLINIWDSFRFTGPESEPQLSVND